MPTPAYDRILLPVSAPAALGELGVVGKNVQFHDGDSAKALALNGIQGAVANDTVATVETVVASFSLPVNYLPGAMLNIHMLGQVSSTATLTFRVRCGTTGTITDALLATFTTSAAGVANQHVSADILVAGLSAGVSGTATAGGKIMFGTTELPPAVGVFAAATVNTTVANILTVTLVQSALQTYTSRAAALDRII